MTAFEFAICRKYAQLTRLASERELTPAEAFTLDQCRHVVKLVEVREGTEKLDPPAARRRA